MKYDPAKAARAALMIARRKRADGGTADDGSDDADNLYPDIPRVTIHKADLPVGENVQEGALQRQANDISPSAPSEMTDLGGPSPQSLIGAQPTPERSWLDDVIQKAREYTMPRAEDYQRGAEGAPSLVQQGVENMKSGNPGQMLLGAGQDIIGTASAPFAPIAGAIEAAKGSAERTFGPAAGHAADVLSNFNPDFLPSALAKAAHYAPNMATAVLGVKALDAAKLATPIEAPQLRATQIPEKQYATSQQGPYYRVTPAPAGGGGGPSGGLREAPGAIGAADAGSGGRNGNAPPQLPSYESVAPRVQDLSQNGVYKAATDYSGGDIARPDMPPSSLAKQSAIGRTFALASEESPAYKAAIFNAYKKQMPEIVAQSGAKNYDELLAASYKQMAKETSAQFDALPLDYSFHKNGEGNYANSKEMLADLHGNGHLRVFQGGDRHDFLHNVDPRTGLNENEKFRAVHDAFGHGIYGNPFGAAGEEMAWGAHSQMYSPLARPAMTSETRGQNSFVNYTPINARLKANVASIEAKIAKAKQYGWKDDIPQLEADRAELYKGWQYAPQKSILLPPEFLNHDYAGGMPDYVRKLIKPEPGTTMSSPLTHFSNEYGLTELDPSKYGTGIPGDEASRLRSSPGAVRDRSYFYLGDPSKVTPEEGLGHHIYTSESKKLYDMSKDPLDLGLLAEQSNKNSHLSNFNPGAVDRARAANDMERLAQEYGYEGVANPNAAFPMAAVFEPKPVEWRGSTRQTVSLNSVGLYSHGAEAAESLPQAKGSPQQFKAMLQKAGVKPAEFENSGFDQAFAGRPSVTRDEVAQHFRERMPKVEERVLGANRLSPSEQNKLNDLERRFADRDMTLTGQDAPDLADLRMKRDGIGKQFKPKFSDYTLPGGENYREVLLKQPENRLSPEEDNFFQTHRINGQRNNLFPEAQSEFDRISDKKDKFESTEDFLSHHWDDPNVLAHLRLSDRTDPATNEKVLHMEELQSDWGQKGRREGFGEGAIPSAPYVTNTQQWTDLGLKRALKEAAEGGYDRLTWTPGAEQAKRYDLSKQISKIELRDNSSGGIGKPSMEGDFRHGSLIAYDHNGRKVVDKYIDSLKDLEEHIGKDVARKLLEQETSQSSASGINYRHRELSGQDLSIGGEGMKSYYDKIVPSRLKELTKKLGGTGEIDPFKIYSPKDGVSGDMIMDSIPETRGMNNFQRARYWSQLDSEKRDELFKNYRGKDNSIPAQSIRITPEMRERILKGQTAFARGGSVDHSPSEAQKAAGNYAKEHISFQGKLQSSLDRALSLTSKFGADPHAAVQSLKRNRDAGHS